MFICHACMIQKDGEKIVSSYFQSEGTAYLLATAFCLYTIYSHLYRQIKFHWSMYLMQKNLVINLTVDLYGYTCIFYIYIYTPI